MAGEEGGTKADFFGTGDKTVNKGNRKAAFVIFEDFAVSFDDFRVDKGSKRLVGFILEIVTNDDDASIEPELGGGHGGGDFVGVVGFPSKGRCDHLVDDFSSFLVDFGFFGDLTQTRIRSGDNFHNIYYNRK